MINPYEEYKDEEPPYWISVVNNNTILKINSYVPTSLVMNPTSVKQLINLLQATLDE